MTTYWDVYLEIRKAARPAADVAAILATDGSATTSALEALHKANLVTVTAHTNGAVSYGLATAARTDADARGLAAAHCLDLDTKVAPYGG